MNNWTKKSIELAAQRDYLDLLYKVYPMSPNLRREIDETAQLQISSAFAKKESEELLRILLKQEIFPIKDSYVAYLRKDSEAISRNPATVQRLTGMLFEMGEEAIFDKITVPKETNRQIGPLFKNWIDQGSLGCAVTDDATDFINYSGNIIYNASDQAMQKLAEEKLGYQRDKGLDFIAKFNNQYILGEAKFLTDFGGHQNAQFADAIATMRHPLKPSPYNVKIISILDGVLYIKSNNKMHKAITSQFGKEDVIISAVLLRDYLYSL